MLSLISSPPSSPTSASIAVMITQPPSRIKGVLQQSIYTRLSSAHLAFLLYGGESWHWTATVHCPAQVGERRGGLQRSQQSAGPTPAFGIRVRPREGFLGRAMTPGNRKPGTLYTQRARKAWAWLFYLQQGLVNPKQAVPTPFRSASLSCATDGALVKNSRNIPSGAEVDGNSAEPQAGAAWHWE